MGTYCHYGAAWLWNLWKCYRWKGEIPLYCKLCQLHWRDQVDCGRSKAHPSMWRTQKNLMAYHLTCQLYSFVQERQKFLFVWPRPLIKSLNSLWFWVATLIGSSLILLNSEVLEKSIKDIGIFGVADVWLTHWHAKICVLCFAHLFCVEKNNWFLK